MKKNLFILVALMSFNAVPFICGMEQESSISNTLIWKYILIHYPHFEISSRGRNKRITSLIGENEFTKLKTANIKEHHQYTGIGVSKENCNGSAYYKTTNNAYSLKENNECINDFFEIDNDSTHAIAFNDLEGNYNVKIFSSRTWLGIQAHLESLTSEQKSLLSCMNNNTQEGKSLTLNQEQTRILRSLGHPIQLAIRQYR